MEKICVSGHQNFWCKKLEECGLEWRRMASDSQEGQGPHRAVVPIAAAAAVAIIIITMTTTTMMMMIYE
jgi:hypothetical protein